MVIRIKIKEKLKNKIKNIFSKALTLKNDNQNLAF